jgi:hypothetical protein
LRPQAALWVALAFCGLPAWRGNANLFLREPEGLM